MDKYIYLFLTQLTVITHLGFILFVIVGGFFTRKKPWMSIVHIAAVVWAVYAELSPGVVCPLTALENYFGFRAGLSTYKADFVTRYLVPIIYQEGLTSHLQFILVGIVICMNVMVYTYTLRWKQKAGSHRKER